MEKEEAVKTGGEESAQTAVVSKKEMENQQLEEALDKLILNTTFNKYDIIVLARRWAYELKSKEGEMRSIQELIAASIRDILSSRISHKMVRDLPHLVLGKKQKNISAAVLESLQSVSESAEKKSRKS